MEKPDDLTIGFAMFYELKFRLENFGYETIGNLWRQWCDDPFRLAVLTSPGFLELFAVMIRRAAGQIAQEDPKETRKGCRVLTFRIAASFIAPNIQYAALVSSLFEQVSRGQQVFGDDLTTNVWLMVEEALKKAEVGLRGPEGEAIFEEIRREGV